MFFPLHFIFVLRTVPQNTYTHIHLQLQCGNKTVWVTHLSFNMEGENLVKERDRAIERKIARYNGKKSWCSRVDKQDGTIKPFSLQKSKIKNISTSTNTCVVLVLKFRTNTSNKQNSGLVFISKNRQPTIYNSRFDSRFLIFRIQF